MPTPNFNLVEGAPNAQPNLPPNIYVWLVTDEKRRIYLEAQVDGGIGQHLAVVDLQNLTLELKDLHDPKLLEALGLRKGQSLNAVDFQLRPLQPVVPTLDAGTTRLYYEAHITVDAALANESLTKGQTLIKWNAFSHTAERNNFRASRFDVDEVDHYDGAWFLSYRGQDLAEVKSTIANALKWLELEGYKVLRWKIEDTLLDSKHGDSL